MSCLHDVSHKEGCESGDKDHGENEKPPTSTHRCTFGHGVTLATGLRGDGRDLTYGYANANLWAP